MRRNFITLVFLLFSAQAHSIDEKSIEKELLKIDEAKKAGLMTDELLLIEKKLLEQKASSRTTARNATNKPKEIIKKKSFKVFKKIDPKAYFTFLDKINSKEEKLVVINNKLVEVRQKLYDLKQTESDSSDIIQLQSEIDLLEIERLKTETSVVFSSQVPLPAPQHKALYQYSLKFPNQ